MDDSNVDHLCNLENDIWWQHDERPYPLDRDTEEPRPIRFVWHEPGLLPPWEVDTR